MRMYESVCGNQPRASMIPSQPISTGRDFPAATGNCPSSIQWGFLVPLHREEGGGGHSTFPVLPRVFGCSRFPDRSCKARLVECVHWDGGAALMNSVFAPNGTDHLPHKYWPFFPILCLFLHHPTFALSPRTTTIVHQPTFVTTSTHYLHLNFNTTTLP